MFSLFKKRKEYGGMWVLVRTSEFGNLLNVDHREIVLMYGNNEVKILPYSEERLEQLKEDYPIVFNIKTSFEEKPYHLVVMNRFELSRLGL